MQSQHRAGRGALLAVPALLLAVAAGPAGAVAGAPSASGPEGQSLTVSKATGLDPAGATVAVAGSGYDQDKGIYVAFCVDNGPGALPTPCGGGADTTGSLGASHWISSNPPSYGEGLAVPYGPRGSFSVELVLTPAIGGVDCTAGGCAVVTRADHTRSADRSQDVRIPVSFATAPATGAAGPSRPAPPGGGEPPGGSGAPASASAAPEPVPEGVRTAAGPVPGAAGPVPEVLELRRASGSGSAGWWWLWPAGGLAAVLAGLVAAGRLVRRRRAAR